MTDERIVALYFEKDEQAISETKEKYGKYLFTIANNILACREDAEECENSTYFAAWNSIPPNRPRALSSYLGKIVRNLSLKKLRSQKAERRGGGEAVLSLDELADCIADTSGFKDALTANEIGESLSRFLRALPKSERQVFICRYFYCDPIAKIADRFGMKESRVKMMLMRTREKLLVHLTKEGVFI